MVQPRRHRGHRETRLICVRIKMPKTAGTLLLILFLFAAPLSTMAQRRKTVVDLIVRGGTIVTMDGARRVIENGAIAVRGGRVVAVGPVSEIDRSYAAREIVNATGKVVIPGLINGHTHVPMTLFRGLADDLDLQEWLTKYIFPAEAKNVTEEFVRVGTRLGLAEMIRGGKIGRASCREGGWG